MILGLVNDDRKYIIFFDDQKMNELFF